MNGREGRRTKTTVTGTRETLYRICQLLHRVFYTVAETLLVLYLLTGQRVQRKAL